MATAKKATTKTTAASASKTAASASKSVKANNKPITLWDNNILKRFKAKNQPQTDDPEDITWRQNDNAWNAAKEQARNELKSLAKQLHLAAPGEIYFVGTAYNADPFSHNINLFDDILEPAGTKSIGNALWRAFDMFNKDDAQIRVYLAAGQLVIAKRNPADNSGATMSICAIVPEQGHELSYDYIAEHGIGLASMARQALGK